MKEFRTAAAAAIKELDWIEFKVDDFTCRAVSEPSEGQVAFLMSSTGRRTPTQEKIAVFLNFFDSVLDDQTQIYIASRMLDPKDDFGLEEVQAILEYLMEEWSGRPTRSSSGSTLPQDSTGPSSTPDTPTLI